MEHFRGSRSPERNGRRSQTGWGGRATEEVQKFAPNLVQIVQAMVTLWKVFGAREREAGCSHFGGGTDENEATVRSPLLSAGPGKRRRCRRLFRVAMIAAGRLRPPCEAAAGQQAGGTQREQREMAGRLGDCGDRGDRLIGDYQVIDIA